MYLSFVLPEDSRKKKNIWRADLIKAIMENIQDVLRAEAKVQISFAQ